jgi:hypothetical protein
MTVYSSRAVQSGTPQDPMHRATVKGRCLYIEPLVVGNSSVPRCMPGAVWWHSSPSNERKASTDRPVKLKSRAYPRPGDLVDAQQNVVRPYSDNELSYAPEPMPQSPARQTR